MCCNATYGHRNIVGEALGHRPDFPLAHKIHLEPYGALQELVKEAFPESTLWGITKLLWK